MQVIYADVLVIINIYITYIILMLTSAFGGVKRNAGRLAVASVLSGLYSLIILVPDVSNTVISITRMFFSFFMLFIAFGRVSRKSFLRLAAAFFAVNFAFAGVMLALWLFVSPEGMYYNSSVVYFDIDTGTLIILTVVCYFALSLISRFIQKRVPRDSVYDCVIYAADRQFHCHCFLDTGNSLKDCYTGSSVIIINKDILSSVTGDNPLESRLKIRLIPHCTVSGEGMLYAFTSEKAEIKGLTKSCTVKNVTVALTEEKIRGGGFDGILPWDIFENTTDEREKNHAFTD